MSKIFCNFATAIFMRTYAHTMHTRMYWQKHPTCAQKPSTQPSAPKRNQQNAKNNQ